MLKLLSAIDTHKNTMESVFCVNCGSAGVSVALENEQILLCIKKWAAPRPVEARDLICATCWTKAKDTIRNCMICSKEMGPTTRTHQLISLKTNTQHNINIKTVIMQKLAPLEIQESHYICHPCWQKAYRAAQQYPTSSVKSTRDSLKCANCGINISRERFHILHDEYILMRVQQQVSPQLVTANDYICGSCHTVLCNREDNIEDSVEDLQDVPAVGHRNVCVKCGRSLARTRSHCIGTEVNQQIVDVVRNWINPREIRESDSLCHRCYQKATSLNASKENSPTSNEFPEMPTTNNSLVRETITLPNYSRASDTHSRCIIKNCPSKYQKVVPLALRLELIKVHNYYVPRKCRICDIHLKNQQWTDLLNDDMNRNFTAAHIEELVELLKNDLQKHPDKCKK